MAQDWFYNLDGRTEVGPVSPAELRALARSGRLRPDSLVRAGASSKWSPARKVHGLFAETAKKAIPVARPVPLEPKPEMALPVHGTPGPSTGGGPLDPEAAAGPDHVPSGWQRYSAAGIGWWRRRSTKQKAGLGLLAFVVFLNGFSEAGRQPAGGDPGPGTTDGPTDQTVRVGRKMVRVQLAPALAGEIQVGGLKYDKGMHQIDCKVKLLSPVGRKYTNWFYTLYDDDGAALYTGPLETPALGVGDTGRSKIWMKTEDIGRVDRVEIHR